MGLRFSANARRPSRRSSVSRRVLYAARSLRIPCSIGVPGADLMACLAARRERGAGVRVSQEQDLPEVSMSLERSTAASRAVEPSLAMTSMRPGVSVAFKAKLTETLGLLPRDAAAGEDELHGAGHAQEMGEALRPARAGDDAKFSLGERERGRLAPGPQVTSESELGSAAERRTGHSSNGGEGQVLKLADHAVEVVEELCDLGLAHPLALAQVGAGAEDGPEGVDNDDARVLVRRQAGDVLAKLVYHLARERVARVRTVQDEHVDAVQVAVRFD